MWHFLWKCFSYLLISPLLYILGFTLASDQILKTARNWSLLEDNCGFELTNIVFISNSHPNHKCAFDKWFMYCKLYVHLHVYQPKLIKACLWHLNFWELFNLVLRSVFWIFSCGALLFSLRRRQHFLWLPIVYVLLKVKVKEG